MSTDTNATTEPKEKEAEGIPGDSSLSSIGFDEHAARAWLEYFQDALGTDVSGWSERMEDLLSIERKAIGFHRRTRTFGVHWEEAMDEYVGAKSKGVPLKAMRIAYEKSLVVRRSHTALLRQFDDHLAGSSFDEETRKFAVRKLGRMLAAYGDSLYLLSREDVAQWLDGQKLDGQVRGKLDLVFEGFLEFIKKTTLSRMPIPDEGRA